MNEDKFILLVEKAKKLEFEFEKTNKKIQEYESKKIKGYNIIQIILMIMFFVLTLDMIGFLSIFQEYINMPDQANYIHGIKYSFLAFDIGLMFSILAFLLYQVTFFSISKNSNVEKKLKIFLIKNSKKFRKRTLRKNKIIKKDLKTLQKLRKEMDLMKKEKIELEKTISESKVQKLVLEKIIENKLHFSKKYWMNRLKLSDNSIDVLKELKVLN